MCSSLPLSVLRSTTFTAPTRELPARRSAATVPHLVASFAGVWEGTLYPDGSDEGAPFSLLHGVALDASRGGVIGHVAFPGRDDSVAADVRLLEASATTYVALVGPYFDVAANAQVVTLLEARRVGDRMTGSYRVRPVAGGPCVDGHFVAMRSRRAAAA